MTSKVDNIEVLEVDVELDVSAMAIVYFRMVKDGEEVSVSSRSLLPHIHLGSKSEEKGW